MVVGSVQSLVPSASAMKLATAFGACLWKNWHVMRPIEVSITTYGPLGTVIASGVAWGASGISWLAGVDCCAKTVRAAHAAQAAARAEKRSVR